MEEKVLIKSEVNKVVKNILKWTPVALFGIAAIIFIILCLEYDEWRIRYFYNSYGRYDWEYIMYSDIGWSHVFDFHSDLDITLFVFFLIACVYFVSAIILGIVYLANRRCEFQVTENNVKGKTLFGKEVVLPLYMISSYATRKFLSVITVATSSGVTRFSLIKNYKEISSILAQKINQRQESGMSAPRVVESASNSLDDLLKLKNLLEAGIITQEEFETKKKQLLGL